MCDATEPSLPLPMLMEGERSSDGEITARDRGGFRRLSLLGRPYVCIPPNRSPQGLNGVNFVSSFAAPADLWSGILVGGIAGAEGVCMGKGRGSG